MRPALIVLALAVTAAATSACSSDEGPRDAVALPSATATGPGPATTTAAPSTGPSGAAATAAPGTGAPTATSGGSAAPTTRATTGSRPGSTAASYATPAGTYTYDVSGYQSLGGSRKAVDGTAELVVSALRSGRQTSTLRNEQGTTTQEVVVRADGSFLGRLSVRSEGVADKDFVLEPPALLLPAPAAPGRAWSWSATSTDGSTTARASNKVVRREALTIGGRSVQTVVLQTRLVLSGDVDYTADITTWVAPDLRLPVKDRTVARGTALGLPFTVDITAVMRSTTPA